MITSLTNEKVKNWMKLHQKKYRIDHYLILEETLVEKAYENGFLDTLIYVGEAPFSFESSYEVSEEVMCKLAKGEVRKWIGIGKKKECPIVEKKRVLLLDDLQDPLNIGKILESACLFGYDVIYASMHTADVYHEKSIEASKGAVFTVPFRYVDILKTIKELKEEGFTIYATGLRDETIELGEIVEEEKIAFILGNEGAGVSAEAMEKSDRITKIDMKNIDSLNVAMAASIIMYRFNKGCEN